METEYETTVSASTHWHGIIKEVLSGSSVVLYQPATKQSPVKTVTLNFDSVCAPKLGAVDDDGTVVEDDPYAWEAREYLRKLVICKPVSYQVKNSGHGTIYYPDEDKNVTELMVAEGLLEVRNSCQKFKNEKLILLQEEAKDKKKGKWSNDAVEKHIRPLQIIDDRKHFLQINKTKPVRAIIELVLSGSVLKVILIPECYSTYVNISGVKCPNVREGEKLAEEARQFVEVRLLQRHVNIFFEYAHKNQLYGSVKHPAGNIAEELLKEGLASIDELTIIRAYSSMRLIAAEKLAKKNKLGKWGDLKSSLPQIISKNNKKKKANADHVERKCQEIAPRDRNLTNKEEVLPEMGHTMEKKRRRKRKNPYVRRKQREMEMLRINEGRSQNSGLWKYFFPEECKQGLEHIVSKCVLFFFIFLVLMWRLLAFIFPLFCENRISSSSGCMPLRSSCSNVEKKTVAANVESRCVVKERLTSGDNIDGENVLSYKHGKKGGEGSVTHEARKATRKYSQILKKLVHHQRNADDEGFWEGSREQVTQDKEAYRSHVAQFENRIQHSVAERGIKFAEEEAKSSVIQKQVGAKNQNDTADWETHNKILNEILQQWNENESADYEWRVCPKDSRAPSCVSGTSFEESGSISDSSSEPEESSNESMWSYSIEYLNDLEFFDYEDTFEDTDFYYKYKIEKYEYLASTSDLFDDDDDDYLYFLRMRDIFKQKLEKLESGEDFVGELDLHYLFMKQALSKVNSFLDGHIKSLRKCQHSKPLILGIITGQGNHSLGGPKIRPAVMEYLKISNIEYEVYTANLGYLFVIVDEDSQLVAVSDYLQNDWE